MPKFDKGRFVLITFVIFILSLGSLASAQTTISIWYGGIPLPASEALEKLVDDFNAANPDINVEVSRMAGYGDTLEKATVAYAGGAPPNLILIEQMQGFGLILRGMLEPINPFIENDPDFDLDDFYPPMLETASHEGVMYGLPFNTSTPLAYLHYDLFEEAGLATEAPRTWDEFASVAERLTRDTDGDGEPDIWGADQTKNWGWLFDAWISQNGARMTNEDGTQFTFNSPAAVEAMEFLQDLRHNRRVITYPGVSKSDFVSGAAGMIHRSTADLFGRMELAQDAGVNMGVGFLPCNVECWVPIGGANLFMMKTNSAEQKEAAWRLLNFLTSTESLAEFSSKSGYMSARRSSMRTERLQDHFQESPEFMTTYEQLEYAHPRPQVPDWKPVQDRIASEITPAMFSRNENIGPIMDEVARYGNQLLEEFYSSYNANN